MRRCAFLTMGRREGFVIYDRLAHEPLRRLGWHVEEVPWRREGVDWDRYEVVVIRSPWDYHHDPDAFLTVLEAIDRSAARLENALPVVRWNLDKTYLRDLDARGIPIVPTVWGDGLSEGDAACLFDRVGADEVVIKPIVGANADDTFWLRRGGEPEAVAAAETAFGGRRFMAQPFVRSVVAEGEFSLFYFGGAYSHAILKTPKPADFRVQEEHGGRIRAVEPEPALRERADAAAAAVEPEPLYARADLVRMPDGNFAVIELELIEPSLYFSYDATSPARFAEVLDRRMRAGDGGASGSA